VNRRRTNQRANGTRTMPMQHAMRVVSQMMHDPWRLIRMAQTAPTRGWYEIDGAFEMWVEPDDKTLQDIVLGSYVRDIVDLIRLWVRPGDVCIDCGAHEGYIAQHLAKAVGNEGRVLAFEPDDRVHGILQRNCARNRFDHVWVYPFVLGEEATTMRFYCSSRSGWSTMFPSVESRDSIASMIDLPVHSLDELRSQGTIRVDAKSVSFIKLSCVGAESLILRGMEEFLSEADPVLSVAVNEDNLRTAGSSPEDLQRTLSSAGYVFFRAVERYSPFSSLVLRREMTLRPSDREYHVIAARPHRVTELERCGVVFRP
jgi:FkbM family methyltransferase